MAEREMFPTNSNRAKGTALPELPAPEAEKRPHAEPVARRLSGKKQETTLQKFAHLFLADDVNDIGDYLLKDLLIPAMKDMVLSFVAAALWGDRRGGLGYRGGRNQDRTSYSNLSRTARVGSDRRQREEYARERRDFDIDNIVFASRADADTMLERMEEELLDYGQVTVGYLYALMEETGPFTLEYYGWRNLSRARVRRVNNGYALELPPPVKLDR